MQNFRNKAAAARGDGRRDGRSRFSVADPAAFDASVVATCEGILARVMDYLDEELPSIYDTLFWPTEGWLEWQPLDARLQERTVAPPVHLEDMCDSLWELCDAGELEWSEGQAAINLYGPGGTFGCHKVGARQRGKR